MPEALRLRVYWTAWFVLLVLTLGMVLVDNTALAHTTLVPILCAAMLVKAAVIGGWFMHLKYERLTLVALVVVSILVVGAILFGLIAPDGIAMNRQAVAP